MSALTWRSNTSQRVIPALRLELLTLKQLFPLPPLFQWQIVRPNRRGCYGFTPFPSSCQSKIWLQQYTGSDVLFYGHYVDDTICLFPNEHDAHVYLDFINSRHPNISFSMEQKTEHMFRELKTALLLIQN